MPYKDPEARRAYARRWREKNPTYNREYGRQLRAANPGREKEYQQRYCGNNHDKKEASREHWRIANPVHARSIAVNKEQRRRARKANAPQGDPQEAAAFAEILREGICELCGAEGPIEVDHIVPLSTGGEHGWQNFAGLCKSCNASKGSKSLLTHMLDDGGGR